MGRGEEGSTMTGGRASGDVLRGMELLSEDASFVQVGEVEVHRGNF